jgi:hypothetical protein
MQVVEGEVLMLVQLLVLGELEVEVLVVFMEQMEQREQQTQVVVVEVLFLVVEVLVVQE